MIKKRRLSTVKDLAQSLNDRLTSLTAGLSEVILVLDTYMYKPDSLKNKTRERGRQYTAPIQYKIADGTNIKHTPLTQFLSHEKTNADLTDYLAKAILNYKKINSGSHHISLRSHQKQQRPAL